MVPLSSITETSRQSGNSSSLNVYDIAMVENQTDICKGKDSTKWKKRPPNKKNWRKGKFGVKNKIKKKIATPTKEPTESVIVTKEDLDVDTENLGYDYDYMMIHSLQGRRARIRRLA